MERNSCVNLLISDLCFCFCYVLGGFSWVSATFYLFSDYAASIFNIILTFCYSLFKTQSFSYKSHFIKTLFAIFSNFTILFAFKIEQLKYIKTLNGCKVTFCIK